MLSIASAFCFSYLKLGLGAGFLPAPPPTLPSHGGGQIHGHSPPCWPLLHSSCGKGSM